MKPALFLLLAPLLAAQWRPVFVPSIDRYPLIAHAARIAGDVRVRVVLDGSGAVAEASALSGHPLLAAPAVENAKGWRFEPHAAGDFILTYTFRIVKPGTENTDTHTFRVDFLVESPTHAVVTAPEGCIDHWPCRSTLDSPEPFPFPRQWKPLAYGPYRIDRPSDEVHGAWTARLRRSRRQLGTFSFGRYIDFGLFPLLPGSKQLVVRTNAGSPGARDVYWIAALESKFRVLYDGEQYHLDRMLGAADLDGDGAVEFWQHNPAFDRFWHPFTNTPKVACYLRYDRKRGSYVPANPEFASHALREIPAKIARLHDPGDILPQHYRGLVLEIVLAYIYAGRESQGWAFFDREYRSPDKTELKIALLQTLDADPFYRELRSRTK